MDSERFEKRAIERLDVATRRLLGFARRARKRAYAPYSKYLVGCAILDVRGKVHTGCNVENASFGATICAERAAIVKMVSRGQKDCRRIVLITSSEEPAFPCGVCLQVLQELARNAVIIAVNRRATVYRQATLRDLMPVYFSREQLRSL